MMGINYPIITLFYACKLINIIAHFYIIKYNLLTLFLPFSLNGGRLLVMI